MGGDNLASVTERKLNDAIEEEFLSFRSKTDANYKSNEHVKLAAALAGASIGASFGPLGALVGGIIGALMVETLRNSGVNISSEIELPLKISN